VLLAGAACGSVPDVVGTVGMLEVPNGSINVVPGRCRFSLDVRATTNEARDACAADVLAGLRAICERRGLRCSWKRRCAPAAAPSAPAWQAALGAGRAASACRSTACPAAPDMTR
jgi:N-carbamoyl-L-amino-acid hydrolase